MYFDFFDTNQVDTNVSNAKLQKGHRDIDTDTLYFILYKDKVS